MLVIRASSVVISYAFILRVAVVEILNHCIIITYM